MVVGSQKRAALLLVVVAYLVYVLQVHRKQGLIAVAAFMAVMDCSISQDGPVRDYLDREAAHPEAQNAITYRRSILKANLDRFSERPILGAGLGVGDRGMLIDVGEDGRAWRSHSEIGTTAAAAGVAGLLALTRQYGLTAIAVWRVRTKDAMAFAVFAATLLALPFLRQNGLFGIDGGLRLVG